MIIMTISETIKKAIEGEIATEVKMTDEDFEKWAESNVHFMVMWPCFWQSLGKSLGWTNDEKRNIYIWKYQWHCFIDHLAEGKSIESFFEVYKLDK